MFDCVIIKRSSLLTLSLSLRFCKCFNFHLLGKAPQPDFLAFKGPGWGQVSSVKQGSQCAAWLFLAPAVCAKPAYLPYIVKMSSVRYFQLGVIVISCMFQFPEFDDIYCKCCYTFGPDWLVTSVSANWIGCSMSTVVVCCHCKMFAKLMCFSNETT